MRWIMNAWLVSVCSLTLGGSGLVAQTPDQPSEPSPSAQAPADQSPAAEPSGSSEQRPQTGDEPAPKTDDDQRRPPGEEDRRDRRPGGPLGGPGGPGPRMMMARLPLMMALDADGNGEISSTEMEGAVAALKKLDKNSDGKLTVEELMPEGMRGPFAPGGPGGPGGPGAFDPEQMVNRMMMADANNDGLIDQEEMPERMKTMMLDRADTDKDGKLSREELTKMVAQMGSRRGAGPGGRGGPGPRGDREGADQPERPRRPRSE